MYCGEDSGKKAGDIAKSVQESWWFRWWRCTKFAQGGGKDTSKKDEAIAKAKSMILG